MAMITASIAGERYNNRKANNAYRQSTVGDGNSNSKHECMARQEAATTTAKKTLPTTKNGNNQPLAMQEQQPAAKAQLQETATTTANNDSYKHVKTTTIKLLALTTASRKTMQTE